MKHKFYNIRGTRYANLGQLNTAISYYEKALSIKPDYAEVPWEGVSIYYLMLLLFREKLDVNLMNSFDIDTYFA